MPRRGTNIYKRKDGRWEARYVVSIGLDGKKKYASVYAATYREAKAKQFQCMQNIRISSDLLCDMDLYKLGVLITLYSGLRVGELCALQWDDIKDTVPNPWQVCRTSRCYRHRECFLR